jgi:hypothetical protein
MRVWTAVLAMGLLAGCFHNVRPEPRPLVEVDPVLPMRAKYFVPPGEAQRAVSDRFFGLGIAHTWTIEIGHALQLSFPQMLQRVFTHVVPASAADDVAGADVLISPTITSFEVDGLSFISTLKVRLLVLGPGRQVLLDEELVATPTEEVSSAGGAFTGNETLKTSAEQSLELLMSRARQRLAEVLKAPSTPPVL